jgi:hypothetical protein
MISDVITEFIGQKGATVIPFNFYENQARRSICFTGPANVSFAGRAESLGPSAVAAFAGAVVVAAGI